MSEEIEQKLLRQIEALQRDIKELKGSDKKGIPTYSFSKIKFSDLKKFVKIEQNFIDETIFNEWFSYEKNISTDEVVFLKQLIEKNRKFINLYHEEDLKINFIAPLISKIDYFLISQNIRNYYNEKLTYKTEKFILNGETDFVISKGLVGSERPYFFIQEFKKGFENSNPEPQLLAELISAVELNNELSMKGAYIIGERWNFVILEKLGKDKYRYFVSKTFNSVNIEDLKDIYKNMLYIKNEILKIVEREEK